MRIVCMSDTHGRHKKIKEIPDGDVLIIAGDITPRGEIENLGSFNKWIGKFSHRYKLLIAGNHDWCFAREHRIIAREMMTNVTYLEDSEIIIDDIKFYGSPWQPIFLNWAFNAPREMLIEAWSHIPDDVDVLITHCPPHGTLDFVENKNENVGCRDLANRICSLKNLKLHVFGHIHGEHGQILKNNIKYVNSSICTEEYRAENYPIVIDI